MDRRAAAAEGVVVVALLAYGRQGMENDIYTAHEKYLAEFGGHRARNDASTHHSTQVSRVAEWKDRWSVLGILPPVS